MILIHFYSKLIVSVLIVSKLIVSVDQLSLIRRIINKNESLQMIWRKKSGVTLATLVLYVCRIEI